MPDPEGTITSADAIVQLVVRKYHGEKEIDDFPKRLKSILLSGFSSCSFLSYWPRFVLKPFQLDDPAQADRNERRLGRLEVGRKADMAKIILLSCLASKTSFDVPLATNSACHSS